MVYITNKNKHEYEELENISINQVIHKLTPAKYLYIDSETTGLDPYIDKLVLLQIYDGQDTYLIDARFYNKRELYKLRKILEDRSKVKVLHNCSFDYKFIFTHCEIVLNNVWDTMIAELVMNIGKKDYGYRLDQLEHRYLNSNLRKQHREKKKTYIQSEIPFSQNSHQKEIFTSLGFRDFYFNKTKYSKRSIEYSIRDVKALSKILPKQIHKINKKKLNELVQIESEFALASGDMELNGMYIDKDKWMSLYQENVFTLGTIKLKLKSYLSKIGLLEKYSDINWNSSQQVVKLFKDIGIPTKVLDKEKSKQQREDVYKDSVGKTHIYQFKDKYDIIPLYLEYKEYYKATSTYGSKFLEKYVHPVTGRIHSSYRTILNTGRISSSNPNLQNIKRGTDYRSCFTARDPKHTLIVADYSQQELRYAAAMSNEKTMIDVYTSGDGDMHSDTASIIYNTKITKEHPEKRHVGKTTNFLVMYGGGEHKLSKQFNMPINKAKSIIDSFWKARTSLKEFFNKSQHNSKVNGYITIDDKVNRISHIPDYDEFVKLHNFVTIWKLKGWGNYVPRSVWSRYYSLKGKIDRDSQNYPIQGGCATMSKLAIIYFRRWIERNGLWNRVKILNAVHDEIVVESEIKLQSLAFSTLEKCMLDAGKFMAPNVPMKVGAMITYQWEH